MNLERNPSTVGQLLTQIRELHNKVNSLSNARGFYDPETASSSGATRVPSQPSIIPSPRTIRCRDSGLPHDTRNMLDTSGNVFERLPTREGRTSTLFNNSKNLASSSQELRPDTRKYKEAGEWNETRISKFINTCATLPKWREIVKSYWWNLFSQWCDWVSEIPDFGIASGKVSWPHGIPKLESQLQNWIMFEISRSPSHNEVDQRSWDDKANSRTYGISIDYGTKRLHRQRYAWCDDCVCI